MESIKTQRIPYSQIRVVFDKARELEHQGRSIIHLEIGRPDFNTPDHIVEAAIQALKEGKHHYCPNAGIPELRQAIVEKVEEEYGLKYSSNSEVIVTNGVAEGVYLAVNALLNPGDQILIPDPGWLNYQMVALTNYVEPLGYPLYEKNNFQPDPLDIEQRITPRTKMILLLSPSNPIGSVIEPKTLERVASLAEKFDLVVLSDEIYGKIVYSPAKHISIATLPGMRDRTLILDGFSKFYSMTGWRIGYVLGPEKFVNPMLRYHQYMVTSVNTFAQWGAMTALTSDQDPSYKMLEEFRKRRDYIYEAVGQIPGFKCTKPEGAFYIFPNVEETRLDGFQMSSMLLEKAGVATVAGECFGKHGAGHIRLSYSNSLDNLRKAVANIKEAMEG
ncbi:MAG: pyridoxal phosphate-dependent aminotransferase [Candidatus Aminicenantes bacterium]|nr:pyridoxal phosphate-dependent aminotransferase [Candidatus Aminicenantes bacterium]MDH5743468.1 pyridoxal phosphate-dependent aminotransferase [Candidatus Aminicenantes bacterium]